MLAMNDSFDNGWLAGFYHGVETILSWKQYVELWTSKIALKSRKIYYCSNCSDLGVQFPVDGGIKDCRVCNNMNARKLILKDGDIKIEVSSR